MKPTRAQRLWSCLATVLLLGPVYSQKPGGIVPASLKTTVPTTVAGPDRTGAVVTTRILRAFERSNKDAREAVWKPILDKKGAPTTSYSVFFNKGDRRGLASYSRNGRMLYSIVYGRERHLPAWEKKLVQDLYPGYQISGAHQVTTSGKELWLVELQNPTYLVKVRVMDEVLDELERYRKFK